MSTIGWAIVFIFGGVLALICGIIVLRRRSLPGALPFAAMMFGAAWWQWAGAMEMLATGVEAQVFWATLAYFGIATVPYTWFLFAAAYSGKTVVFRPLILALLALPGILRLVIVFTNAWHHLYWTAFIPGADIEARLIYEHGPLFWALVVADYFLMLAGTVMLGRAFLRSHNLFRRQVIALMLALFFPWAANALYIFDIGSLSNMDLTPLALTLTGVTMMIALLGSRLFDLMPVAREAVVEKMSDGVIVLDAQNRIVDLNRAVTEMFALGKTAYIGQPAAQVFPQLPAWVFETAQPHRQELQFVNHRNEMCVLTVQLSLIKEQHNQSGRILLLHDITEHKQAQAALEQMNRQLQAQLQEIQTLQATLEEQAVRDPLTGLFNRRYLYEMLAKQLNHAARAHQPLSVVLLDIDHFKSFNDLYGHYAGDMMLKTLASWLQSKTRRSDFICRFGGEEFVIVMPDTNLKASQQRAQEWCAGYRELHVWYEEKLLHTTLSLGVAAFPEHGTTPDDLIHSADLAMYAAKQAGRDCVRVASAAIAETTLSIAHAA